MITEATTIAILDALDDGPAVYHRLPDLDAAVTATSAELAAHLVHLGDLGAVFADGAHADTFRTLPENGRLRITAKGRALRHRLDDADAAVRAAALVGIGLT